ncbi:amino acid ABC transporter permease [Pseudomonas chlororaphis]|uniref:Amino acid ABC transporter, permease protein, 3-TM region, His/Glu/Gln/Arg/opine family n=1 Tax=Pseudomonas chlororaphis O6 TaxID=1037915 RepID=A0AB33WVD0_9PSED|nr:amino acid ABC transporter permease [Pseudomonas chlororaphis]EIM16970.1 amino acid ABC transporter, permease protein, 3-TM region, His/Glu/Gln/Arg/opine family [Pseudomonas chlororaphis O6]
MLDIIHEYWLLFLIGAYPNGPLGGVVATLLLSITGIGLALPLSVLLALAQLSGYRVLRYPACAVRYVLRSIPLVMLIFATYFIVPMILGRPVAGFTTMAVTLVIFQATYLAEIVRAGIEALPRGQVEAAVALGMGYWTRTCRIVLPQALKNMLPSLVGQFVTTIKDTSLGYVIGVNELTYAANQVNSSVLTQPFGVFLVLSLVYFAICFTLTQSVRVLEARIERRNSRTFPLPRVSTSNEPVAQ